MGMVQKVHIGCENNSQLVSSNKPIVLQYVVEQFVGEAMDLISQYGSNSSISYTVHNIVGRPTKFPSYGNFSQTFVMGDYGPWWRDCPSGQESPSLPSAWSLQSRR